jgi:predicted DNA-binding protein YlxM (UPF0122 family)
MPKLDPSAVKLKQAQKELRAEKLYLKSLIKKFQKTLKQRNAKIVRLSKKGLSQSEIAKRFSMTRQSVGKIIKENSR